MKNKSIKICLLSSSGGHFEQLMMLKSLLNEYDGFILTEKTNYIYDTDYDMYYLVQINRKEILFPFYFLCNCFLSLYYYLKYRPDLIITTGALCCIPMALIAKLFRKKLIFIESFAKIDSPTQTGKFLYRYADRFYIQWPDLVKYYPDAIYKGGIY